MGFALGTEPGGAVGPGPAFQPDSWTFRVECLPGVEVEGLEMIAEPVSVRMTGTGVGLAAEVEVDPEEAARHEG